MDRTTLGKTGAMMLSPINGAGSTQFNRTTAGGFSFLTSVPGADGEIIDLIDLEQRKAQRIGMKQLTAVKLKVLDDFNRRLKDQDFSEKTDKAIKMAKKLFNMRQQERVEHNHVARDEKIKKCKQHLQREEADQRQEGLKELKKEEEEFQKRWNDLEEKRKEYLNKKEAEYKVKRDQIMKFEKDKLQKEVETCQYVAKVVTERLERGDQNLREVMNEKIRMIQDHNDEIVRKRAQLSERRFEEWMEEQGEFMRYIQKQEKKHQDIEKKKAKNLEAKKDKHAAHIESQHQRKSDEDYNMRQKHRKIMEKFETSGKLVEKF